MTWPFINLDRWAYKGNGVLANFMESLVAVKELVFAFFASSYLLWDWLRRRQLLKVKNELRSQKQKLDGYIKQTIAIERKIINETSIQNLLIFSDDVTWIKLAALEEFTHEELRSDHSFQIFLSQCTNIILKIQSKILLLNNK